jgi:hypothetical protein
MTSFKTDGYCPICEKATVFLAESSDDIKPDWWRHWFRGALLCTHCGSLPRERALMSVLQELRPDWRQLSIHESSPGRRGASRKLQDECPGYIGSHYYPTIPWGSIHPVTKYRSEDLTAQTFPNDTFDVVVTQDVFEHLFDPGQAIAEIARTMRLGGITVMTVPMVRKGLPSQRRAEVRDGQIVHLQPPQYHGNPASSDGSLVTIDWGYDIASFLSMRSGMGVSIHAIDDISRGIRAVHNDVVVCRKSPIAEI